jgi:hypothetical protein
MGTIKKVILDYYNLKGEDVITESGFRYEKTTSVITGQEIIEAKTDIEVFEKFYKLNNRLRYCNGSYYKFQDKSWENLYNDWLNSEDYQRKSFNLYYGNGVVD